MWATTCRPLSSPVPRAGATRFKGGTNCPPDGSCPTCGRNENEDFPDKVRLVETALQKARRPDLKVAVMNCVPAGTLIMTDSGPKPIESVNVGDHVLTHKGRFREVEQIFQRHYRAAGGYRKNMVNLCPRCGRGHSGICGIPPGVSLGFGARAIAPREGSGEAVHGKPVPPRHSIATLDAMLTLAKVHLVKVLETLKKTPPELPEYPELLDRESKLNYLVKQLIGQIASRS